MTSTGADYGLLSLQGLSVLAAACVLGYLVGLRAASARISPRLKRRQARLRAERPNVMAKDNGRTAGAVCECGAIIPGRCTPEELARHKASNRHARNMLRHSAKEVVACEEVSEYRAAAMALLKPTDLVLEIGSHVGGTTKFIASVAKRVVGVDQQPELVAEARQKHPDIQFENFDAFDAGKLLALKKSAEPDIFSKVFIDISGSRDLGTVFRLMDLIDNIIKPELQVVKSQPLKKMLLRSRLWIHHPDGPHNQLTEDNLQNV
eukprot:TRINITY_DN10679_c0_g2_i1.p1 TRINITY_DN10679_c0_g2~~TRINITY_DN10679_c0_g2_i1.p1  ORF type:complete len:263 (+),score=50.68 TRINITY_DN10679_c0_g2_i1:171-959(+)